MLNEINAGRLTYADSAYHRNELRSILEHQYGIHLKIVSTPRLGRWVHKDHIGQALEYLRTQ